MSTACGFSRPMAYTLEVVGLLLCLVAALVYRLGRSNHSYWKQRGVPGPEPQFFLGTQGEVALSRTSLHDSFRRLYLSYPGQRYVGLLLGSRPALLLRDLALVRRALTQDFHFMPDRGFLFTSEDSSPLSANLFVMGGSRWRSLRYALTPAFTSGKMRRMFPLMLDCFSELTAVLGEREGSGRLEVVELRDLLARCTTDVIGSCAFGVRCGSQRDPDAQFYREGCKVFEVTAAARLRVAILSTFPRLHFLGRLLPVPQHEQFFLRVVRDAMQIRDSQGLHRGDFIDLLMELRERGKLQSEDADEEDHALQKGAAPMEELKFTDSLLASQAFAFFVAGFEAASSVMSFAFLELALNPDFQRQLCEEVDATLRRDGGRFTYEGVMGMPYLEKVVCETLRKYPPGASIFRKVVRPYRLPDSDLVLEPGVRVHIPTAGIHMDPEFYPEPDTFDPERFTPEARAARPPHAYLPFGDGPRTCIGMRFGLQQIKVGLAVVLSRFEVQPCPLTVFPVRYKPGAIISTSLDGCYLSIRGRVTTTDL